ncbi:hypothetical protein OAT67_08195 [Bacteriovoracaceae bacterium]|nr:hypothetical protein [Bacteriovoracaceae bacterium]
MMNLAEQKIAIATTDDNDTFQSIIRKIAGLKVFGTKKNMALSIGVSERQIYRIIKGEDVSNYTLYHTLKTINLDLDDISLINKYEKNPYFGNRLSNHIKNHNLKELDATPINNLWREIIKNDKGDLWKVFIKATTSMGASLNWIEHNCSQEAMTTISKMHSLGLVKIENQKISLDNVSIAKRDSLRLLKKFIEQPSLTHRNQHSYQSLYWASVNKNKVYSKIKAILDRANKEIIEVLSDPENEGNDSYLIGMISDGLNLTPDENAREFVSNLFDNCPELKNSVKQGFTRKN